MIRNVFRIPEYVALMSALTALFLALDTWFAVLGMKQPAVSHQLRFLRNIGLVRTRREGKRVWYSLDDDHVRDLLAVGSEHVTHREPLRDRAEQTA